MVSETHCGGHKRFTGRDKKGKLSILFYCAGVAASFLNPWLGILFYIAVLVMWFIPDTCLAANLLMGAEISRLCKYVVFTDYIFVIDGFHSMTPSQL